jgi:hypothetical protein
MKEKFKLHISLSFGVPAERFSSGLRPTAAL